MADAANVQVKTWQNGALYIDWRSSGSWYAGYRDASIKRTGCVKFTLERPATSVSITIKTYQWEYTGAAYPLYYELSRKDEDENYIDRTTVGDSGKTVYWDNPYEERTITLYDVPAGTNYMYLWAPSKNGQSEAWFYAKVTVTYEPVPASSISEITKSVYTTNAVSISMNRVADFWHKARLLINGVQMAETEAFASSISYTVPRSWFSSFPKSTSLTVNVSVQTFTDQACTTATGDPDTGSFTLYADSGMKPLVSEGFAVAEPYNSDGAAAGLSGYIQGYSKAKISFDSAKVDLSAAVGATIAGYKITAAGQTDSASPFLTPVLTGKTDIVCTVTDTRGRSASVTLTVTPESYSAPSISQVSVFRCLDNGEENEDGSYLSAKAEAVFSPLNGQNSVSMSLQYRVPGGSWSAAVAMASGSAVLTGGTMSPDQNYEVMISIGDMLNTGKFTLKLGSRKWGLKFRENGDGVGFGMAPQEDKVLQIPADWMFMVGEKTLLDIIYPIGSVYISSRPTDPGTLFGGTWARIKDCFILAAGDTYAAGATGGEAKHTLTESEMPSHKHTFLGNSNTFTWGATSGMNYPVRLDGQNVVVGYATSNELVTDQAVFKRTANTGGGNAFNNMPPYITRYVWERTA